MKLLVIGGTVFLGRHFVELALSKGHQVTLFHRGQHGADLFPEARHVFGDRDGGLGALPDERWDAVVDCCGYVPRVVRQSAEFLLDKVDKYLFVSTISVYADASIPSQDETAAVAKLKDPSVEEVTGESYGGLKALCEEEVRRLYGEGAVVVRPGLIAGPYDPTNRFTYWADRFARGGLLVAPPRLTQPLQIIDVRDLTVFMLHLLLIRASGVYNATGPSETSNWDDMLQALRRTWPDAQPVHLSEQQLAEREISLWQELPLCIPEADGADGMMRVSIGKAVRQGLTFRSWEETARDTQAWSRAHEDEGPKRHGLAFEKEAEALAALGIKEKARP